MSFGCHSFLLSPSLLFPRRHEGAHSRAPAWLIPQAAPSGCTAVEADPAVPEPWTGVPYAVGLFTPSPSHPPTPGDPTPFAADACFCPMGPACSASALLPPAPMVPTGSVGPRFCPGSADSPAAQEDPRLASFFPPSLFLRLAVAAGGIGNAALTLFARRLSAPIHLLSPRLANPSWAHHRLKPGYEL